MAILEVKNLNLGFQCEDTFRQALFDVSFSLEKGKIELSDFSENKFSLAPTQVSSKYTRVELGEILEMLMSL